MRMCLCGILAAEYPTLPAPMRGAVTRFFDDNETWLTTVLERGRADGSLSFDEPPGEAANMLVSGLEGAWLVARPAAMSGGSDRPPADCRPASRAERGRRRPLIRAAAGPAGSDRPRSRRARGR